MEQWEVEKGIIEDARTVASMFLDAIATMDKLGKRHASLSGPALFNAFYAANGPGKDDPLTQQRLSDAFASFGTLVKEFRNGTHDARLEILAHSGIGKSR